MSVRDYLNREIAATSGSLMYPGDIFDHGWARHLPGSLFMYTLWIGLVATAGMKGDTMWDEFTRASGMQCFQEIEPGEPAKYRRFEKYYGAPLPKVDDVRANIQVLVDLGIAVMSCQNGEETVDYADEISLPQDRLRLPKCEVKTLEKMQAENSV